VRFIATVLKRQTTVGGGVWGGGAWTFLRTTALSQHKQNFLNGKTRAIFHLTVDHPDVFLIQISVSEMMPRPKMLDCLVASSYHRLPDPSNLQFLFRSCSGPAQQWRLFKAPVSDLFSDHAQVQFVGLLEGNDCIPTSALNIHCSTSFPRKWNLKRDQSGSAMYSSSIGSRSDLSLIHSGTLLHPVMALWCNRGRQNALVKSWQTMMPSGFRGIH